MSYKSKKVKIIANLLTNMTRMTDLTFGPYILLIATTGSIRAALYAGMMPAMMPTEMQMINVQTILLTEIKTGKFKTPLSISAL